MDIYQIVTFVLLWCIAGFSMFIRICYEHSPHITIKDVLVSLIAAPFLPLNILLWIFYTKMLEKPFFSKKD